jgi:hypothetical protein
VISTEPEEINEDVDPFEGAELSSDTEGSDDENLSNMRDGDDSNGDDDDDGVNDDCSNTTGSDYDGRTDPDVIMEDTLTYDISLDSTINSEDEGIDLEDEDTNTEDGNIGDKGPVESNHGLGGAELDIVPPWPTPGTVDQQPQPYSAGCVWTAENWSCSYDTVFMAFWSLYEQSSTSWRDDWMRFAPDWNGPLGNNFDHLILLSNTSVGAQDRVEWFCRYRDRFRDQLSYTDPSSFPRKGRLLASASRILEVMFGRSAGPYLEQHLACANCEMLSQTECEIGLLTMGFGCDRKTPVPLHTVLTTFVHQAETDVHRLDAKCSHCRGPNKVQGLKMPAVPWIWFERDEHSPVRPSLTLTFHSQSFQLDYSLRGIIYSGGNHFTVRFREQSGGWWRHDGRVASGVPQPDDIQFEVDLLASGDRFACILIYRRDDR